MMFLCINEVFMFLYVNYLVYWSLYRYRKIGLLGFIGGIGIWNCLDRF